MQKNGKVKPRKPSGFPEFLPNDQMAFNRMVDAICETYELFGFIPIETPAIELTEVLLAKGGGETDKQMYRFIRGDTDLSLHFDLTVPLARYVAEHYADLTFPFRRYQVQKVWRAERAQKGRFREFLQCDVDVIGSESLLADAEMIGVVSKVFEKLKVGDFVVRVNNRKILMGFLESIGLDDSAGHVLRVIDKLEKQGRDVVARELRDSGIDVARIEKLFDFIEINGDVDDVFDRLMALDIENEHFLLGVEELRTVVDLVALFGVSSDRYRIDLTIARGLDYYTGTVYETSLNGFPELGSIASGGRYDDLAGYYTDKSLPGVGISIGLTRLFSKLKELELVGSKRATPSRVLVCQMGEGFLGSCITAYRSFQGKGIPTEMYPKVVKLKKQLEYANRIGIDFIVVIGESEFNEGKISLKNMRTGEQSLFHLEAAINTVKETISKDKV